MPKFQVKKWYLEYQGYHNIEAENEQQAKEIEQDLLHDEGMDPDEFIIEVERIDDASGSGV